MFPVGLGILVPEIFVFVSLKVVSAVGLSGLAYSTRIEDAYKLKYAVKERRFENITESSHIFFRAVLT